MNKKILALLAEIETVCNAWNETKETHAGRGGWIFNYKLYDMAYACEDNDVFYMAAEAIREDWDELAREAAGYVPETWDYSKYFEHDRHNGSYFNFREDVESAWSLDFWANNVGLEWDVTTGKEWGFTPFEKAVYDTYGTTRFSTDRLALEDYDEDELADIADTLEKHTLPALRETLAERLAVIKAYDAIKADQVNYLEYAREALAI